MRKGGKKGGRKDAGKEGGRELSPLSPSLDPRRYVQAEPQPRLPSVARRRRERDRLAFQAFQASTRMRYAFSGRSRNSVPGEGMDERESRGRTWLSLDYVVTV